MLDRKQPSHVKSTRLDCRLYLWGRAYIAFSLSIYFFDASLLECCLPECEPTIFSFIQSNRQGIWPLTFRHPLRWNITWSWIGLCGFYLLAHIFQWQQRLKLELSLHPSFAIATLSNHSIPPSTSHPPARLGLSWCQYVRIWYPQHSAPVSVKNVPQW